MIRLIALFLIGAGLAAAIAVALDPSGSVAVFWEGRELRWPLAAALGVLLAAAALLAGACWIVWTLAGGPRRRRASRADAALARGLAAAASGDAGEARRLLKKGERGGARLLARLLEAQIALAEGDEARAARVYAALAGDRDTEFLGLRGLFRSALRRGDVASARRLAARAFELKPKSRWTFDALFEIATRERDWPAAEQALAAQAKTRAVPPDVAARRRAVLACAAAVAAESNGYGSEALKRATDALAIAPGLVPAAAIAARQLSRQGKARRAQEILGRAWETDAHPDLAAAWDETEPDAARRIDQLVARAPRHPESLLLGASIRIEAGQLDAAAETLAPLLRPRPTARAARIMAEIAAARGDDAAAAGWSDAAAQAPRDAVWRCSACGADHAEWSAVCGACGGFDALSWVAAAPGADEASPAQGARLLYRRGRPAAKPAAIEARARPALPLRERGAADAGTEAIYPSRPPDDPGPIGGEDDLTAPAGRIAKERR